MNSFPIFANGATFAAWRADPSNWLAAAMDIARAHSLPHANPHVFATGTNLVVALDQDLVLKIYPPLLRHQFVAERASLMADLKRGWAAISRAHSCGELWLVSTSMS
jgi:hygromycin-B 7''-O-kinase